MTETGATILVVDDEEPIRNVIARKLELVGHNCTVAADAREAIEKTFMQEFDLMLVDVKMPGMSGMEVLSHAAANHPDTGVIMITAVGDNRIAVEAKKKGAYDYVTKPFDLDDLELRVSRALERRGLLMESRGRDSRPGRPNDRKSNGRRRAQRGSLAAPQIHSPGA
jgi:DNA-binding NtrC family response regulator